MSDTPSAFQLLLRRVREGLAAAAAELVETFGPVLLAAIRCRLERVKSLCRLVDAEDLAQDVWLKFFRRPPKEDHFPAPHSLATYLARAGRNAVRATEWHYLGSQKRELRRKQPLGALAGAALPAAPDRTAAEQEESEDFLQKQRMADRPALALLLQGWTVAEVAEELGRSERSIRRSRARAARPRDSDGR